MNLNLGTKTIADFITFCTTNNLDHGPDGSTHVARLGNGLFLAVLIHPRCGFGRRV